MLVERTGVGIEFPKKGSQVGDGWGHSVSHSLPFASARKVAAVLVRTPAEAISGPSEKMPMV